jgi:hypothetical protein
MTLIFLDLPLEFLPRKLIPSPHFAGGKSLL